MNSFLLPAVVPHEINASKVKVQEQMSAGSSTFRCDRSKIVRYVKQLDLLNDVNMNISLTDRNKAQTAAQQQHR